MTYGRYHGERKSARNSKEAHNDLIEDMTMVAVELTVNAANSKLSIMSSGFLDDLLIEDIYDRSSG